MTDYKKLYIFLFNKISDIIDEINIEAQEKNHGKTLEKYLLKLRQIQIDAEEIYISD